MGGAAEGKQLERDSASSADSVVKPKKKGRSSEIWQVILLIVFAMP